MSFGNKHIYAFKDYQLDPSEDALLKKGKDVPITPKALQLLRILVENHGKVVRKEELISKIWENCFVEEGNLAWTARLLRKVLGDDARNPVFIETVPRKGYRFIAEVYKCRAPDPHESANVDGEKRSSRRLPILMAGLLAPITSLLVAGFYFFPNLVHSDEPAPILSSPFAAERLTSTGNAVHAAISPNGRLAAYTDLANGKWSLWLRLLETAEHIQILPPTEASYAGLTFSRNGNSLYFARSEPESRQLSIYQVNAFGGVPTKILENTEGWISLSPDDTKISFVRCPYEADDYCSLFVADVDGRNERKIVTCPEPMRIGDNKFSPDGRSVAFAAGQSRTGSDDFGLYRVDLDSGRHREIARRRFFNIKHLEWLSDGDGLLVTARSSLAQKFSIWRIDVPSGVATQITSDDANFSGLSLDEKSEAMVATKVDNDFAIYLSETEGGISRKLVAGTDASFLAGGSVVYESPDRDIWTIDADGRNKRQLTSGPFTDQCPISSPDGRTIFFGSNRGGVNQVWRMNIDGSDQRQLTQAEGGCPAFVSLDGDWLYYRGFLTSSFRKIRTDGSDERGAAEIDKVAGIVSRDRRLMAYFDNETAGPGESTTIAVRALNDQTIVQTLRPNHLKAEFLTLQWSSDSRSILYVIRQSGEHLLWRWRLDSPKPELVTHLGIEPVERIVISFDGLTVASVRGKWLHDAFLLSGLNNSAYIGTRPLR